MSLKRYEITRSTEFVALYTFVSTGAKGDIVKAVLFSNSVMPHLFNLGFGDMNATGDAIDDLIVTDNGDTEPYLLQLQLL